MILTTPGALRRGVDALVADLVAADALALDAEVVAVLCAYYVSRLEAARAIVGQMLWPLLGGTLVGIIAFAPIGLAPGQVAEYTNHLFWVMMISLLFSWFFAVTVATPLTPTAHGLRPA